MTIQKKIYLENNIKDSDLKHDNILQRTSLMPKNLRKYMKVCKQNWCIENIKLIIKKILANNK